MISKNYFKREFASDLKAGFITAIVALPLAIGFAIASGVSPIIGIYTAIIAGMLGSAIGGSRYSITGPTGAMTVIILSSVNRYGLEGLFLAGLLAGLLQILFGIIKLGKLVKFIPLPVIAGFTAGIGGLIFIGQIGNFLGLTLTSKVHIWETFIEILNNLSFVNYISILIALFTIGILILSPKFLSKYSYLKNIPPSIIALVLSCFAVFLFHLNVPTIGVLPREWPSFNLIKINFDLLLNVLPAAFTIAMLGAIESLLCAVVCDGMTNTKHNSNRELISQGICNCILPFFGAIPATAAIARSAVNIREGAKTRMAGVYHALFLLAILLFFSPFALYIPKAFLAGVLMVVSFRMINLQEFKAIVRTGKYEASVLIITLVLTILTDLVFAVQIGMLLAIFLLFIRMVNATSIKCMEEYDSNGIVNSTINKDPLLKERVSVYTIHGPFFFGAMNVFEQKIKEHINSERPLIIIRMKHVPFIDGTAFIQLLQFLESREKAGSKVLFTEFWPGVKEELLSKKEFAKLVSKEQIFSNMGEAISYAKNYLKKKEDLRK